MRSLMGLVLAGVLILGLASESQAQVGISIATPGFAYSSGYGGYYNPGIYSGVGYGYGAGYPGYAAPIGGYGYGYGYGVRPYYGGYGYGGYGYRGGLRPFRGMGRRYR